ncbi:uncharacterized protein BO80DRAFT_423840 [Aspergillus ibericus CBS 121593]|uniref:Uncharacterized protein n=1 Tax=Aspergillus ibericus CBS 121593 TaxID=1448316 RepID=A0A395H448_9EURO|nr:hypothetical protein BO80DRAFT_423840 [Aspergillus ibericus CBS 121593]RAL02410.1 hypothetical protein BO80DRAFT_423840 [Aspergillus ibericus CBS 121593]
MQRQLQPQAAPVENQIDITSSPTPTPIQERRTKKLTNNKPNTRIPSQPCNIYPHPILSHSPSQPTWINETEKSHRP